MEVNDTGRKDNGTFEKGTSGNPGGRPKGLAQFIREQTNGMSDQVRIMIDLSLGKPALGQPVKNADAIMAVNWLADRGYGKAVQKIAGDEESEPIQISFSTVIPRPGESDIRRKPEE